MAVCGKMPAEGDAMRALVYTGPRRMRMENRPRPVVDAGEVEIAVTAAGICGVDLAGFLGRSRHHAPPLILGHELAGCAADGRRVVVNPLTSCGHCAACRRGAENLCAELRLMGMDGKDGCFAEFVAVPEGQVHGIPEAMTDARAVLAEPLANIVHLFRLAAPEPLFRMGIVGAGTMGSLALRMALEQGARAVLVEEVEETRLEAARLMGATLAVNAATAEGRGAAREFAGYGLDLVVDACGTETARQEAFELCRPGGTVALLGMAETSSRVDFGASIRKEHRVMMSFGYTPGDFERSLALLAEERGDLTPWTLTPWTVEMPLEEGQMAFEAMAAARGATLKTILRMR
jgi:threonine dehydrogenase-like Zn-dependent dehydrogenase